jgi:hypothetical protein
MPIHDWTRVIAGTYHDFHNAWITELRNALNGGLLPQGYYALGEQRSGDIGPEVLTLHSDTFGEDWQPGPAAGESGMIAVAERPPQVRLTAEAESEAAFYITKRRTLAIHHASDDRIVALIEILSPGNKHSQRTLDDVLDKAIAVLREGFHLLVVDLFPPTRHDPDGVHGLIWEYLTSESWRPPLGLPLTLASYCVKTPITAYVEPACVGEVLSDMPLFLTPDHYINVPLENTYMAAWRGVPERWRKVIELAT